MSPHAHGTIVHGGETKIIGAPPYWPVMLRCKNCSNSSRV
jgi:hypothetical protein